MRYWITGIAYVVVGFLFVVYAPRASEWFKKISLKILEGTPRVNMTAKERARVLERIERSRFHTFEKIWMWTVRVLGVLLMISGFLILTVR